MYQQDESKLRTVAIVAAVLSAAYLIFSGAAMMFHGLSHLVHGGAL